MTEITTEELRGVARSIRRVVQPTTTIDLLDVAYTLRRESRPRKADRDYAVLKALATGRRCVLDVGANLGLTALLMATTMAPDGRLFAFETSEQACRIIGDNAALNGLADRIVVVNALIAERSGLTIDFYGDFSSGGASIIPGYLAHNRPLRKATMALDDFVADCGCAPDLLKIDVEGAELRVLEGLTQTMAVHRPLLFVELHSWGDVTVSNTVARLLEQLDPLAYRLIYLRHKAIVDDPAVFAKRGRCHVLLCPNESSFFEELATLDTTGL